MGAEELSIEERILLTRTDRSMSAGSLIPVQIFEVYI
jgi:hypothetical protein